MAKAKKKVIKAKEPKPTFVCKKCGNISEREGCVCCNRH